MKIVIRQYPESVVSRPVTDDDIPRILETVPIMYEVLNRKTGLYKNGHALAHVQVVDKDPLRFYVLKDGSYVINPVIVRHTRHTVKKLEGCLSFCTKKPILMDRFHTCDIEVQMVEDGKLGAPIRHTLKGIDAQIVQHEIEHFDGITLFDSMTPQTND